MRIALAQVNATVGDLPGNSDLVIEWTRRAVDQGARLSRDGRALLFPELWGLRGCLAGYRGADLRGIGVVPRRRFPTIEYGGRELARCTEETARMLLGRA